jgi:hypothetical protein
VSHEVLRQLGPDIQQLKSYVAADKTFRVCLAKDESVITSTPSSADSLRAR